MGLFKKKERTQITLKEKNVLLYLLLNDVQNDTSPLTIRSRVQKIIELLHDLGIDKERIDLNKERPSDEFTEEIFYNLNCPSKDMSRHDYKVYRRIYDKL
ncbi:hypothetical protein [Clostridium sp.]|uniref:hypothetical protein n=1 Tax=Clostridium sp. TaxID=1506 RepID=UPI0025C03434|nr:hypothetical protein [Clostridium sp.]